MKYLSLLMSAFLLISCGKNIEGKLKVKTDMDFNKKSTLGQEKTVMIPAGEYSSKITITKNNKVKLTVKNILGEDKKVTFALPEGMEIPTYTGEFFLDSSVSGQPYDLKGKVGSSITNSQEYSGVENCTYTEYRNVCSTVCNIENGHQVCRPVCHYQPVNVYGRRYVSFYYRYTDTFYTIDFLYEASDDDVANFKAVDRNTDKHYTHIGNCY